MIRADALSARTHMPDIDALKQEHDALRRLSRQLAGTCDSAGKTRGDLLARIEHHAKEAKGTMFSAARKSFDDDERKTLDKQYIAWS
jgi:hypothetical protein